MKTAVSDTQKELGVIEYARLGTEDHGIMTFMIGFNFGGTCQGFGGYALDTPYKPRTDKFERKGTAFGCECIIRILEAVGVEDWGQLVGKEMWCYRTGESFTISDRIVGIEAPKYRKGAGRPFFIEDLVKEYHPERDRKE